MQAACRDRGHPTENPHRRGLQEVFRGGLEMSDKPEEYLPEDLIDSWLLQGVWNENSFKDCFRDILKWTNKKETLPEDHGEGEG